MSDESMTIILGEEGVGEQHKEVRGKEAYPIENEKFFFFLTRHRPLYTVMKIW